MTNDYNLHSHTQFCDGRASMEEMAHAAYNIGMKIYGFSPHSPLPIESTCNMSWQDVDSYISEGNRLKNLYKDKMQIFVGMEVDYLSPEFGPHNPEIQSLPLDYRIGSVHFVPNQSGVFFDCDGSAERFAQYVHEHYGDDLRYVVERYFQQILEMLEFGGFDILGHFDKIIGNAVSVDASVEDKDWYVRLVEQTIDVASQKDIYVEINTKALSRRNRFYPDARWWKLLVDKGCRLLVNSDAHEPALIDAGRREALDILHGISL